MLGSALDANREFFEDYVSNGRSLARGSLFVHTLPSSPLAAAALCYGLNGPLVHYTHGPDAVPGLIDRAIEILQHNMASAMVIAYEDEAGH
jgi:hypothetical protein